MPAKRIYTHSDSPDVTVVIPSLDGYRDGNVDRLVASLTSQTIENIELIISKNERPNGHARNVGITRASPSSQYYFFFDDDVTIGHHRVLEFMIKTLRDQPSVGLTGASQLVPVTSGWFEQWVAYDLARNTFPIVSEFTETDMVTHAGIGIRKDVWIEMDGESDILVTGTDTDLRERLRNKNYMVGVAPLTWVFHPVPADIGTILKYAVVHGKHQVTYRKRHGFQTRPHHPFHKVDSVGVFIFQVCRELLFFLPHIFIANRSVKIGFRPINALFRLIMVVSYTYYCYKEFDEKRKI